MRNTIFLAALLMFSVTAQAAQQPMNVVFILADDLGYSDTTLYGTTDSYQTPNIERLAARGMTFNRAYANSPLCSPTRMSILTGQTPARHGATRAEHSKAEVFLKATVLPSAKPSSKVLELQSVNRLDTAYPTLGKLMKEDGYATGHFGKWHLGRDPYSPLEHGFDVDLPHTPAPGPAGGFIAPWKFAGDLQPQAKGEHIEDRMAKEASKWMNTLPRNKPSFMNYWQFSVHAPFQAKPELEANKGNYYIRLPKQGWKGPVEEIMFSRGAYADNGIYEKYKERSEIGIVAADIPVRLSGHKIIYTSENFTQSGVQLLKFTPAPSPAFPR